METSVDQLSAKSDCESRGSHLVYIETSDEQAYLEPKVDELQGEFWIGIEKDADGNQVWMDGTGLTFDNFLGRAIDGDGHCFRITKQYMRWDTFVWLDRACTSII